LVNQRTGIINQIRAFLLERGIAVRQGLRFLRSELPRILSTPPDVLSPRMVRMIEDLTGDWRRLDERIEALSNEIVAIARRDAGCERLMSVPGIGPIISSAMVAAIGTGDAFTKGRDFGAWLGLVPKQKSTGDRTILGKISRRGNRYLRVLFVQAAWVVLIKPKIWERHALKTLDRGGQEAAASQCAGDCPRQQARPHEDLAKALLHDSVEDQGGKARLEDVRNWFGDRVKWRRPRTVLPSSQALGTRPRSEVQFLCNRA
jgi:transposase